MIGGLMKTTSRFALVAAAGILMGSWSMTAKAADLGGDCCADLEERVAELEATTVRKGNRKVSLELSGQVNKALLAWNDGKTSDVYVVDNNYSSTRFRLKGTGVMAPGWKAGFFMEYEFRDSSSNLVDQTQQTNRNLESALRIRQENVFVESEKFGRVTLGQQNSATKDIELIDLGGDILDPENYYANQFKIRDNGLGTTAGQNGNIANASRLGWGVIADTWDTGRLQAVRYDTPSIYGFIVSAAWGENDFWDIAVRYQKEWNSIRIAAGIGYFSASDPARLGGLGTDSTQIFGPGAGTATSPFNGANNNVGTGVYGPSAKAEFVKGSASAMHIPTGLFVTFAAGQRYIEGPVPGDVQKNPALNASFNKDATFYEIKGGITKRFFEVGATTVFGAYANYDDQGVGASYSTGGNANRITSSNVDRYAVGFTQAFDGAALELYANYVHYSADISAVNNAGTGIAKAAPEDYDAVVTGARIKF